jgi:hypothetical protein
MIKLNFLLAARDFSATIKKWGCNAHASLKLEFSSFEDIRCTEREIEVVDVFKDSEFFYYTCTNRTKILQSEVESK